MCRRGGRLRESVWLAQTHVSQWHRATSLAFRDTAGPGLRQSPGCPPGLLHVELTEFFQGWDRGDWPPLGAFSANSPASSEWALPLQQPNAGTEKGCEPETGGCGLEQGEAPRASVTAQDGPDGPPTQGLIRGSGVPPPRPALPTPVSA